MLELAEPVLAGSTAAAGPGSGAGSPARRCSQPRSGSEAAAAGLGHVQVLEPPAHTTTAVTARELSLGRDADRTTMRSFFSVSGQVLLFLKVLAYSRDFRLPSSAPL